MSDELMIESYNLYLLHACRNGNELGAQQVPGSYFARERRCQYEDELGNTPLHWVCHSLRNKDSNMQEKDNQDHGASGFIILSRLALTSLCNKSGWMFYTFINVGNGGSKSAPV